MALVTDERFNKHLKNYGNICGITVVLQPLSLVRTLVQVGYEPIEPVMKPSVFGGQEREVFPGLFSYLSHIRSVDGWLGMYRGVLPCMIHAVSFDMARSVVSSLIQARLEGALNYVIPRPIEVPDNQDAAHSLRFAVERSTKRFVVESVVTVAACVIVNPLKVVSVRAMAQFVGRETVYSNVFTGLRELYRTDGLAGFFVGLAPLIIARVGATFIRETFRVVLDMGIWTWAPQQLHQQFQAFKEVFASFIGTQLMYPYTLIYVMMAVNRSGLAAGSHPIMADYGTWQECRTYLHSNGLQNRGSNIFLGRTNAVRISTRRL